MFPIIVGKHRAKLYSGLMCIKVYSFTANYVESRFDRLPVCAVNCSRILAKTKINAQVSAFTYIPVIAVKYRD